MSRRARAHPRGARHHDGDDTSLDAPPYGRLDAPVLYAAAELGYDVALWSHHLPTEGAETKVDRDLATASPGMIILCHDGRGTPAESLYVALERLVQKLTERGIRFVTMSEMDAAAAARP